MSRNKASTFLSDIQSNYQMGIDSLHRSIDLEDSLYTSIEKAIEQENFSYADSGITALLNQNKNHLAHILKGMLFEKQQKYAEAVTAYTMAIQELPHSSGMGKRANVYLKQGRLHLALADFRNVYRYNYDYSFQIGNTFELLQEKDSALKYYSIYATHYPLNDIVKQKLQSLK